jgi:inorganic triphosphatase YgiF
LLTALAYKTQLFYILTTRWEELIRVDLHSTKEEQLTFIQDTISEDYAAQKKFISTQEKSLLHSIRLRKHALSQNISAFDSIFQTI